MQIGNTEIVKKLLNNFFCMCLHLPLMYSTGSSIMLSFCANANRAKLKIVGSSCNTAADFLVSVMGGNGRECPTTVSKNHDTDINCRYMVIFFTYKCMDIVRVFRRNV